MVAGHQAAGGRGELLAFVFVPALFHSVFADRIGVRLFPDVRQQAVVVCRTGQQLIQHVLDVNPHVQVVTPAAYRAWNPQADEKALIDDFFRQSFGPAESPMRRIRSRTEFFGR